MNNNQNKLAADKRRYTQMELDEMSFVFSRRIYFFIRVYLRLDALVRIYSHEYY